MRAYKSIEAEEMEMVTGCINNESAMQEQLYNKYKDAMYTLAYRITSNPEEAKDALQDGFIEVFKSLHNFKGPFGLSKWIKVIIIRSSLRFIKKHQVNTEDLDDVEFMMPIIWPENLNGEVLQQAINELQGFYKTVFVMIEIEGYQHDEVSKILDITESNSKVILHRSKKMLREILKDFAL